MKKYGLTEENLKKILKGEKTSLKLPKDDIINDNSYNGYMGYKEIDENDNNKHLLDMLIKDLPNGDRLFRSVQLGGDAQADISKEDYFQLILNSFLRDATYEIESYNSKTICKSEFDKDGNEVRQQFFSLEQENYINPISGVMEIYFKNKLIKVKDKDENILDVNKYLKSVKTRTAKTLYFKNIYKNIDKK